MMVLCENCLLAESLPILITWLYKYIRLYDRNEYSKWLYCLCMYVYDRNGRFHPFTGHEGP